MPDVLNITKRAGIAGQFQMSAVVDYGDGPERVAFVGSTYGGPVVMVTPRVETFVTDPGRFGSFAEDPKKWVQRFFA